MPRHPGDRRQLEMPRVASNQMLPNFVRTRSLNGSSHEIGDGWPASSERFAATHRRTRFGHPSSGVFPLIDTHCDSHSGRYVEVNR